jgi:hypothetical protein
VPTFVGIILDGLLGPGLTAVRVAEWFSTGREPESFASLDDLYDSRLRAALRAVSPLEPGGLGMFDRPREIERVDELYLFLRQAQFYKSRELLLMATEDAAPAPA